MPIDDRTTNRSYKLPNAGNFLADDVVRLRDALAAIDADVYARYTKTEVDQLITDLIAGAPGALNTLDELAAALGDDANFAATVTNQLALKANASNVYSKAESDARYVQGQTQAEMVFIATANQSVFTLTTAVINKPSALVTVDGVVQPTSEYSINMTGTQLTLSESVPAGTVVRVLALGVSSEGAPADDSVTTSKLRDGAVTTDKLAAVIAPTVSSLNGGPLSGARNRIINGDMRIDQRNAVVTTSSAYSVDRWQVGFSTTGAVQVAKSNDAPATFSNSLLYDVTTADTSIAASEYAALVQVIEGLNTADLAWGSASAQTVTLSFWIKSTTTGTYCVSVRNSAASRSYVAEYSILVANTWEKKTITIPGDISGTWLTDNGAGIQLGFAFACGSTYQTTANSWTAGNFLATSNQVNLLASATNEARITGVQLEPGSVATPFERRSYGQELALCQRYYELIQDRDSVWINSTDLYDRGWQSFKTEKRAVPTINIVNAVTGASNSVRNVSAGTDVSGSSSGATVSGVAFITTSGGTASQVARWKIRADSEL